MSDLRIAVAQREAKEFFESARTTDWFYEAVAVIALAAMAYWEAPVRWMILAAVVAILHTISALILNYMRRLDAGRAYLEQCCSDIERRLSTTV